MLEKKERDLLDLLKNNLISQTKLDEAAFGPEDIKNDDKRPYYLKNMTDNCFNGTASKDLDKRCRAVRSSAAMIYNTLGDIGNKVTIDKVQYEVTKYESTLTGLKGRTKPHLDVELTSADNEKKIFIEAKCLEWLSSSEKLSNAYLNSDNYYDESSSAIFIESFKKFIEQDNIEQDEYKSIYTRYNSKQMGIHILGIYNLCIEQKKKNVKLPREIKLLNIVWSYDGCEEYETEENEGKEFCEKANEFFSNIFETNFDVTFKVEYVRYSDFLKRIDWSEDNARKNYLKRYEYCGDKKKNSYSDEEFIKVYKQLYEETWHKNDPSDEYQERIKKVKTLESDAFDKEKSENRYNPKGKEEYTKEQLESKTGENKNEVWKFLLNPGYTKYAVSSEGRVAFKSGNDKYEIISQYDINGNGYLKLDYERKYNLDHSIEVYKLIAMGFLGKTIGDGYDVHHKINDGYNCRPSNLILLTRAQHNAVHSEKSMSVEKLKVFLKE